MKQIILIRHAESEKNNADSQLTKEGEKQCEKIANFLEKYEKEAIFASLYQRARETAKLINKENNLYFFSNAFNEYYVRTDGTNVESISQAQERALTKIYSIFSQYESIIIVAHSSINQTILQSLLNFKFDEAAKYFKNFGEVQVLRYDYKKGDTNWQVTDSFIPKQ